VKTPVRAWVLAVVIASALSVTRPARAQQSGDGFRFQQPSGSWSLRGGFAMPSAGSDLFSFTTSTLTVNRGDFRAFEYGADLAFAITPRLDLVFDISHSGMSKGSEFRDFAEHALDSNQQPIQLPIRQTTGFQRTPVTVNVRYYLTERGRQIGHYAWVPNHIVPYIGAGVGEMSYGFDQAGDFVDNSTLAIFTDAFHSSGWVPMAQALAGVEWSTGPNWAIRAEGRYLTASAAPGGDFSGFHRIDLSGVTSSLGLIVRF
jgi:hypothetical protein